ncbi:stability/partitioning determinant [Roseicella sp. DB1501]|uniref:stability/partitioning determinant n=1 Tax=Roseicella sp. DB1501 TaxID=2730925 RepID=UPI0014931803|nr:stability/partitioning determinant [Roseicella sp. DB1501]NOG74142.1 stability/partitioning determinant [Roseicella sp. DB1501]
MSDKRAGLFEEELDVSGFAPRPPARPEQVKAVAEEAGFRSRGPAPRSARTEPLPAAPAERREQRRYRTGRNQQLNLKVRAEDAAAFYAIADAQGWVLGDAFARAIAALTRELQTRKR